MFLTLYYRISYFKTIVVVTFPLLIGDMLIGWGVQDESLTQAGAANIAQTMTQFAKYFILPSFLLFRVFFIILEWAQISAFAKGMTPYPKWCWIFSLPIGMIIAKICNIFGNHACVNAIHIDTKPYFNVMIGDSS